jgi:hypothetical protein
MQLIIDVDFNSNQGETSSLMYFPLSFKRKPAIVTARKIVEKDSAGTIANGDGDAVIQFVNTQYCYISLQEWSGSIAGLRGYTLNISGWVPV